MDTGLPVLVPPALGPREALRVWIAAMAAKQRAEAEPNRTLLSIVDAVAAQQGDRPALLDEQTSLTYRMLSRRAHSYAAWALEHVDPAGGAVCLLMPNGVDYVAIWMGLTHAGCTVALLNTQAVGPGLVHAIAAARAGHIVVAAEALGVLDAVAGDLPAGIATWVHGAGGPPGLPRIDVPERGVSPVIVPWARRPSGASAALLIYTSGTTGWPKAAVVTHARIIEWSVWFAAMTQASPDDRMFDCLPMYHSVGGVVAVGAMLTSGGSVLIRRRFSASRFWDDVVGGGCTLFQYIGELCRHLLAAPPHAHEGAHRLRLCCGNGLAGDVWAAFQARFGGPRILEFYAATEGAVSFYNVEGRPGAVGRVPPVLRDRFQVMLVRVDPETLEPLRDASGWCIKAGCGEPGEAVGRIAGGEGAVGGGGGGGRRFDGYTAPAASAAKLLHDAMEPGDRWFRTGDLMRMDRDGFLYFIDRLGDTFRWKGENVSTTEVAAALRQYPGVRCAVAYGVEVPGHEGRAGMAALETGDEFDLGGLPAHLARFLPPYAWPVYIRLCPALPMTSTFKPIKGPLVEAGLAWSRPYGPVWRRDPANGGYTRLHISENAGDHRGDFPHRPPGIATATPGATFQADLSRDNCIRP